jgi:hypothetical protein
MDIPELLLEIYGRVPPLVAQAVEGLTPEQLIEPPVAGANPVGWLVWHLTRVEDHHIAELLGADQIWVEGDWAAQCGLSPTPSNTGYGHTPAEVGAVQPASVQVLLDYLGAVDARTRTLLQRVTGPELDRIVDRRWDPPVTMGVRLVSIADDCLQHAGQAAYARGLLGA